MNKSAPRSSGNFPTRLCASLSRPLSTHHLPPRIYSGSVPPLYFIFFSLSSISTRNHRGGSTGCPWPITPKLHSTAGTYAGRRGSKHHTYHRRSSIGDHVHHLPATAKRRASTAQLWAYAHIRSHKECATQIDLIHSCMSPRSSRPILTIHE